MFSFASLQKENWDSKRVSDLPKLLQPRAGMQIQVDVPPSLCFG